MKKIRFVIFIILFILFFLPVKFADRLDNNKNEKYIIVKSVEMTGVDWYMIGDENGLYSNNSKKMKPVVLKQNTPEEIYGNVLSRSCLYKCYAEYAGLENVDSEYMSVYNVKDCKMVYPIDRNSCVDSSIIQSLPIMPKGYMNLIDIIQRYIGLF